MPHSSGGGVVGIRFTVSFLSTVLLFLTVQQPLQLQLVTAFSSNNIVPSSSSTATSMASTSKKTKLVFHWFRHGDLRIRDNPALMHTVKLLETSRNKGSTTSTSTNKNNDNANNAYCIPLFIFNSQVFGNNARTQYGNNLKHSPKRVKFIQESVLDLRHQLESIGSGCVVKHGTPEQVFHDLLTQLQSQSQSSQQQQEELLYDVTIVCQKEVLQEECNDVKVVESVLKRFYPKSKIETIWGSTMYELNDLPFNTKEGLDDMPDTFTPFRNKVEKHSKIQIPLPSPSKNKLPLLPMSNSSSNNNNSSNNLYQTSIPTLKDLGYTKEQIEFAESHYDPRGVMKFIGGETSGLQRIKDYIWTKKLLKDYFDTRNGMLGSDYSTKFSPWLAHGCISPRTIAMECRRYEEQVITNKSTYWVVFECLWRDYCKFFCLKHGNQIFHPYGLIPPPTSNDNNNRKPWSTYDKNFQAWKNGQTGYPLVDANMRELQATGFMSNRGRQNVCSFLTIDMNHDWRHGGDWFESVLLDYDVYSNWYNWCAGAGLTGGRLNRFNIAKQSKDYDQQGEYVRHWLPELKAVPNAYVHEPWKMTQFQQMEYGCKLGVDYPNPIIPPSRSPNSNNNSGDGKGRGKQQQNQNRRNNGSNKQRKANNGRDKKNPHQKYEMKSLKQGGFDFTS